MLFTEKIKWLLVLKGLTIYKDAKNKNKNTATRKDAAGMMRASYSPRS